jgi:hypothetical protein
LHLFHCSNCKRTTLLVTKKQPTPRREPFWLSTVMNRSTTWIVGCTSSSVPSVDPASPPGHRWGSHPHHSVVVEPRNVGPGRMVYFTWCVRMFVLKCFAQTNLTTKHSVRSRPVKSFSPSSAVSSRPAIPRSRVGSTFTRPGVLRVPSPCPPSRN